MSDHSKPRRWTVPLGYLDPLGAGMTEEATKPTAVREDCITTEDVEAVAKWLFGYANAPSDHTWETIEDPGRDLWRYNARSLLARIFEGGEQS